MGCGDLVSLYRGCNFLPVCWRGSRMNLEGPGEIQCEEVPADAGL